VKNPFKPESGSRRFLSSTKARRLSLCIIIAVAIGAVGLLFIDNKQGKNYLKTSTSIQKKNNDNIILASSSGTTDIQHRPSKQAGDAVGSNSNKEDDRDGEELQLSAAADKFEMTDTMKASPSNNGNPTPTDMSMEIEQTSRAYPIWIDKQRAVNSNSRPYGWCVSEDLASNDESPKGLLFVKVHKCSSSTGAGVTLRIQDGLSKRLNQPNQNQTADAHGTCFAHYNHATARELRFEKRDPSQSFLWSIVREPAQRTLSHYFYFDVSSRNDTATEDGIMTVLKFPTHPRPWHPQHNYQSKYLDLPSQNEQSSSSTERIINGYDFLGVSERMEESLVVLAMLAQIPLTDVVIFSSKVAGGYGYALGKESCVKLEKKWTTPKIDEYILGDYHKANKDDYLLYNAAQRSLDKTIDALGRKRVEENVELLKSLQQQNDEQCASKTTMPCPQPEDESLKKEHKRLAKESCYKSDFGCGHACTDEALADYAEKEWSSITSS